MRSYSSFSIGENPNMVDKFDLRFLSRPCEKKRLHLIDLLIIQILDSSIIFDLKSADKAFQVDTFPG